MKFKIAIVLTMLVLVSGIAFASHVMRPDWFGNLKLVTTEPIEVQIIEIDDYVNCEIKEGKSITKHLVCYCEKCSYWEAMEKQYKAGWPYEGRP